jgi:hypothetical protein
MESPRKIGVWSKRWELNTLLLFLALGSIHGRDYITLQITGKVSNFKIFCSCFEFRYVAERSPQWFETLKSFFETTPTAAVGEVYLYLLSLFITFF